MKESSILIIAITVFAMSFMFLGWFIGGVVC